MTPTIQSGFVGLQYRPPEASPDPVLVESLVRPRLREGAANLGEPLRKVGRRSRRLGIRGTQI